MKKVKNNHKMALVLLTLALLYQCSSDPDSGSTKEVSPEVESINTYFNNIPDWENTSITAEPDIPLDDIIAYTETNVPWKCPAIKKNLVASQEKIICVGTNQGKIWPGAIIEGNSVEPGDIKLVITDRAPITINSDLVINNTFRVVDKPNSVTVQQAIAEMQIEAGNMEEGNQAGAGQMNFKIEESSSFSQSMLAMGVSAGFTEPQSQVGLEGSTNVSNSREAKTHTVMARFVQEKFTVRLAEDLLPTSADFFRDGTTLADIEALESAGKIGQDNIPLYIESVTYGRILLFSMTSTSVGTASELSAALEASFADYVEGGANLKNEQKELLENSTTKIYSAGGTEDGANAAVASLDWSQFFVPAPVATAIPISFTARTLNGNRVKVKINSNIIYEQRQDCQEPVAYNIKISLDKAELTKGICAACLYSSYLQQDGKTLGTLIDSGVVLGVWSGPGSGGSLDIISKPDNPSSETSFTVTSGYCTTTSIFPLNVCPIVKLIKSDNKSYLWPYANLKTNTATNFSHKISEGIINVKTIEFEYSIVKTPIWQ
ncbi:thiol-activated cytolysin family protein [Arenibacter echinorum]|uniref:Thiol-activated cytolysin n=1 Tax=Arenibacter echinorum TaxID=440515 RepID=A0A327R3R7_9FLAO|nr:thiol-activated cytolysin family protein [Arenibacter echinorum]RAJ10383.1 thiol-activated cytolysin [Arenibacter echinorum]